MSHTESTAPALYGLMAEFDSVAALLSAATRTHAAGYTKKDTFSPFPIHGMDEALGIRERAVAPIVLAGGLLGLTGGWGLEYWTSVIDYPMNVGGRPYNAWVNFIPLAFETTILLASISAVVGMIVLERSAAAVSPGVQRQALRTRQSGHVLPCHRSDGSKVRSREHARVPRGTRPEECGGC